MLTIGKLAAGQQHYYLNTVAGGAEEYNITGKERRHLGARGGGATSPYRPPRPSTAEPFTNRRPNRSPYLDVWPPLSSRLRRQDGAPSDGGG